MARYCDGVDDFLGGSLTSPSTGWTMSAWMRAETGSVYPCALTVASTVNYNHRYRFALITANDTAGYTKGWYLLGGQGSGDDFAWNPSNVGNTGVWYQGSVSLAVEAGTGHRYATVWQDGAKGTATRFYTLPSTLNIARIGCEYFFGANQFPVSWTSAPAHGGDVAEIGLWDVVLEDEEHLALAEGVPPSQIRPANLLFYAPLYGRESPEPDLFGGCKLLTVTGATAARHPPARRRRRSHAVAKASGPAPTVLSLQPIQFEVADPPTTVFAQTPQMQPVLVDLPVIPLPNDRVVSLEAIECAVPAIGVAAYNGQLVQPHAIDLLADPAAFTAAVSAQTLALQPVTLDVSVPAVSTVKRISPAAVDVSVELPAIAAPQGKVVSVHPLLVDLVSDLVTAARSKRGPFRAVAGQVATGGVVAVGQIITAGQTGEVL